MHFLIHERCTIQAVDTLIKDVLNGFDNREYTYDYISHSVLLDKLEHYGIRGNA